MSPLGWMENQWGLLENSALEESIYRFAYSWSEYRGSRLKTAWGSDQLGRAASACSLALTISMPTRVVRLLQSVTLH